MIIIDNPIVQFSEDDIESLDRVYNALDDIVNKMKEDESMCFAECSFSEVLTAYEVITSIVDELLRSDLIEITKEEKE